MSLARDVAKWSLLAPVVGVGGVLFHHHYQRAEAVDAWRRHRPDRLGDIGTTDSLRIVPLVDWYAADADLMTDAGVSYLVETDQKTVLFDTGNNSERRDPAPLVHNMDVLGIEFDDIDEFVISHAHYDHVGGRQWSDGRITGSTFGIGNQQPDLGGRPVLVPTEMSYPGTHPSVAHEPRQLARGLATTGIIPRRLFVGWIDEQALVVNVDGKGLVLIVGCGHQTLRRLVTRVHRVFDAPIYGIVGGLHYPVPDGRTTVLGINVQRRFASGEGPLDPIDESDVREELELLADYRPGLVSISPHDTSDEVLEFARRRFGDAYSKLEVGRAIEVEGEEQRVGEGTSQTRDRSLGRS